MTSAKIPADLQLVRDRYRGNANIACSIKILPFIPTRGCRYGQLMSGARWGTNLANLCV